MKIYIYIYTYILSALIAISSIQYAIPLAYYDFNRQVAIIVAAKRLAGTVAV